MEPAYKEGRLLILDGLGRVMGRGNVWIDVRRELT